MCLRVFSYEQSIFVHIEYSIIKFSGKIKKMTDSETFIRNYSGEVLSHLTSRDIDLYSRYLSFDYLKTIQLDKISSAHRQTLCHWIFDTCADFGYSFSVPQLAILYLDYFLSKVPVQKLDVLEMLGTVSVSLAVKFSGQGDLSPKEMFDILDGDYDMDAIVTTQMFMLDMLEWRLDLSTAYEITQTLLSIGWQEYDYTFLVKKSSQYAAICYCDYQLFKLGGTRIAVASVTCALNLFKEERNAWLNFVQGRLNIPTTETEEAVAMIFAKLANISRRGSTASTVSSDSA